MNLRIKLDSSSDSHELNTVGNIEKHVHIKKTQTGYQKMVFTHL